MFSAATKLLFAISAFGVATAIAFGVAVDDRSGVILFVSLAVAALVAALATAGPAVLDLAPPLPADAPPPERRATTTGAAPRGSVWPVVAATATTVLAVGAALDPAVVGLGAVLAVVAAGGWLAHVWTEHPSWAPRVQERVRWRLVMPIGLPLATFFLTLFVAITMSRLLLAISKNAAVWVALVVATALLATFAWLALRPRVRSSVVTGLTALGIVSAVGAGIAGAVSGEREFHQAGHAEGHEPLEVVARDTNFEQKTLRAEAGEEVVMRFENLDHVYHNVAIYKGEGPTAVPVFNGEGFLGEAEREYLFTAPAPGEYVFVCDFHVNMKGTFVVEPRSGDHGEAKPTGEADHGSGQEDKRGGGDEEDRGPAEDDSDGDHGAE